MAELISVKELMSSLRRATWFSPTNDLLATLDIELNVRSSLVQDISPSNVPSVKL